MVLQLAPNGAEVVDAGFSYQPLGGTDRAFGESMARFGVVAEIDAVGGRIENDLVHADRVAFAKETISSSCRLESRMIFWMVMAVPEGASFFWAW
jgi:hypothetical protein